MKHIKIVIVFFMFFITLELFPQTNEYSKVMYVNAEEGLRVRELPSINSERIGILSHLTRVEVYEEDENYIVIDNIRGKWVRIEALRWYTGWVFGGYLMNENDYHDYLRTIDIEQRFLTAEVQYLTNNEFRCQWWQNNSRGYYEFYIDGTFVWAPYVGDSSILGAWYIEDNKLFLEYKVSLGLEHFSFLNELYSYQFINKNVLMEEKPVKEDGKRRVLVKSNW